MSQKELLEEGFASKLGGLAKKGMGQMAAAAGAVGGALKRGAEQGVDASWGSVAQGAIEGGRAGAEFAKDPKQWLKNKLKGRENPNYGKLDKLLAGHIEGLGYMINPKKPNIEGTDKVKIVDVVQLEYDKTSGQKIAGAAIRPSMRTFEAVSGGKWKEHKPKNGTILTDRTAKIKNLPSANPSTTPTTTPGSTTAPTGPAPGTAPTPGVVTNSFSQKNLLRQLHMLQG